MQLNDLIARINVLAKKAKTTGLTLEEAKEQSLLRSEYLKRFRSQMLNTIQNVKILDPEGNDVTPEKVKALRGKNRYH
jgi:uncharacterized protein YnzC (UPF0291/DUF896 family)